MLNKFLGIGNLTKDPQLKELSGEKHVCVFSLAINLGKNDKTPLFIDVQCWDNVAKNCAKYLQKGRKVFVEGKLVLNSWTNKNGEKRNKIFCKANIVTFMNGEEARQGSQKKEDAPVEEEDLTKEDEELQNIPF